MVDTASWTVSGGLGVALCSAIDQLQNLGQVASPLWASVSSSFVTAMFTIRLGHFSRSLYAYPFISSLHMLIHMCVQHMHTRSHRGTHGHSHASTGPYRRTCTCAHTLVNTGVLLFSHLNHTQFKFHLLPSWVFLSRSDHQLV